MDHLRERALWERADLLAVICLFVKLSLFHWYPRLDVVLDFVDS